MKKTILLMILTGASLAAFSQSSLVVTVTNIRETKGSIRVGLYNNAADYLKKVFQGKVVKAEGAEATVTFENLPAGEYAISIIHDENENEVLDSTKGGIPLEGYGFGNNIFGKFGPPAYDKVKVVIGAAPVMQRIALKYLKAQQH